MTAKVTKTQQVKRSKKPFMISYCLLRYFCIHLRYVHTYLQFEFKVAHCQTRLYSSFTWCAWFLLKCSQFKTIPFVLFETQKLIRLENEFIRLQTKNRKGKVEIRYKTEHLTAL